MRKYYTFNEDIVFHRVARRYDLDIRRLMLVIVNYVLMRHDVHFTIGLTELAKTLEPFVKNELKPTIQELCRVYDSGPVVIELDDKNRIRLYADSLSGDKDGV